jgi:hypothetical protein
VDGDGNGAEYSHSATGGEAGIDYRTERWGAGISAGFSDGDVDLPDRGSRADVKSRFVSAYGRLGSGGAGVTAVVAASYGWSDADVARALSVGALSRGADSSPSVESWSAAGELRYGFALGAGWSVGPTAFIEHGAGSLDGVAETGAGSLVLTGSGGDAERTRYGAGAFMRWEGAAGSIDATLAYAGGGGDPAEIGLLMSGAASTSYRVRSAVPNEGEAALGLAGRLDLGGGWSIGGGANARIGSRQRVLQGEATIGWRF